MGGVAGHLAHLYDNRELSYNKIAKIMGLASRGEVKFIEKADGYNIYLGFKDGSARWARNKGDMSVGGKPMADLIAREFAGGPSVKKVYIDAFDAYETAVNSLSEQEIVEIFGSEGEIFYNSEIMGPSAEQLVNYDSNVIAIHHGGHKMYNSETDKVEVIDAAANSKKLDAVIDRFEQITSEKAFSVQRTAVAKLMQLGNDEDLKIALAKMRRSGFSGGMTIEEFLEAGLRTEVENKLPHFAEHTKQDIIDRILKKTDSKGARLYKNLNSVYKGFPKDQKALIREFSLDGPRLLSEIIFPIEEAIHDFAVELLKGMQSAYILDNEKELNRLRNELQSAIENIVSYQGPGTAEAQSILAKQLKKIKHHDNINTVVEGVVFEYEGQLYKFTGNFAPVNQILGLFKYGRGDVPPIRKTEEQSERLPEQDGEEEWDKIIENVSSFALVPGGFKPPHRGHLEMVQNYSQADHVFILMSGPAKSRPRSIKGEPISFELSKDIWDLYLRDAGIRNYSIIYVGEEYGNSPVRLAYEMLGSALPEQTVYMVCGDKGSDPQRYGRAAAPEDVKLVMTPCGVIKHSETGESLSATFLRNYVESGNFEEFLEYIPGTSNHRAEEIFQMLGGERQLKESMSDVIFRLVEEALNEKKKKVKNKYAVCTASIGKTAKAGTKRSEWTKAEEERYERCKKKVEEAISELASQEGIYQLVYGVNTLDEVLLIEGETWDRIKQGLQDAKDWTYEQYLKVVKPLLEKLKAFIRKAREAGIFGRHRTRSELHAVDLFSTKKYIKLGAVFLKLVVGVILDNAIELPKKLETLKNFLEFVAEGAWTRVAELFGVPLGDIAKLVGGLVSFGKDREATFGGHLTGGPQVGRGEFELAELSSAGGAGGGNGSIEGGPSLDGRGSRKRRKKQMPLGWYELEEEQEELEEDEIDPKPRRRRRTVVMKEKELAEAVYELFMNSGTI